MHFMYSISLDRTICSVQSQFAYGTVYARNQVVVEDSANLFMTSQTKNLV